VILNSDGEILLDECGYCAGDEVALQQLIHSELLDEPLPLDQVIELAK
jgi:hypothetical protein